MKKINIGFYLFMLVAMSYLTSCQDKWSEHYNSKAAKSKIDLSISEYVNSDNNFSIFKQMLELSGYDTILNQSQTYTLWLPNNNAFASLDLSDEVEVSRIVKNHIARFLHPVSSGEPERVQMLSGKKIPYVKGEDATFGSIDIDSTILVRNGIVHVIDDYVPFLGNIFEYLGYTEGMDSLYNYLDEQNIEEFDPYNSVLLGVDSLGNYTYDSIFYSTNWIFDLYGDINDEDSVFSAILLNNELWTEAYDTISPYFVSAKKDAENIQDYYTKRTIVKDLFFRDEIVDPSGYDSLVSTSGTVFNNPAYLFDEEQPTEVSNGYVYVVDDYKIKPEDSFLKEIRIEAENRSSRLSTDNCIVQVANNYNPSSEISNNRYIIVEPTTSSMISKVAVEFALKGTLAAKYNVYVVFVPTSLANQNDLRPFKSTFYLGYTNENGSVIAPRRNRLVVENTITNADSITKLLVAENFEFPFSDLTMEDDDADPTAILRVEVNVNPRTETATYSRTMRIDCVILEPVIDSLN